MDGLKKVQTFYFPTRSSGTRGSEHSNVSRLMDHPNRGSMSVGGRAGKTCQSSKLEIIETARLRGWPSPQPKTKSGFTPRRKAKVSLSVNGCCGQLGVAGLHRFPLPELWHLFAPLQVCGPARSNPCHRSSNVGTFSWRSLMARA